MAHTPRNSDLMARKELSANRLWGATESLWRDEQPPIRILARSCGVAEELRKEMADCLSTLCLDFDAGCADMPRQTDQWGFACSRKISNSGSLIALEKTLKFLSTNFV